ncbi:hypothetical protein FB45DRAFT_913016 [Roridomyces roridus]|uniref:Phorbol-ester/DAG-type domain-containing protein n=1 Tax=Roridomyces roridus TaxID=1738132 RepID=A0AAD7FQJ7_9AGAR|nr:hypothetical protein FB45DRAFT_913016 [Roridomyces roridus]
MAHAPTPTIQIPTSDFSQSIEERSPISFKFSSSKNRIRESRNLVSHLLSSLKNRALPPSVYNTLKFDKDDLAPKVNYASPVEEDTDEDDGRVFSTESTLELITQLRDVLIISAAQGWQLFDEDSTVQSRPTGNKSSPFRISRNRNSLQPSGGRSRSPSPMPSGTTPELLSECISILASVILEDCRFQTAPRPSRPPNSLQALMLDVAQFLIHTHRRDPKIVCEIGLAMIPAFSTFPRGMFVRLLAFFEDGVIRSLLDELSRARRSTTNGTGSETGTGAPLDSENFPGPVIITVDSVQDDRTELEPSNGWSPWSSTLTNSQTLHPINAPSQSQQVYYLAALVPPLLVAMLESVDLDEGRPDIAHRFYRLVDLIVTAKPDSYLDLMEVAAYSTQARRPAMNLISNLWPRNIGHLVVGKQFPSKGNQSDAITPVDPPYAHHFVPWIFSSQIDTLSASSLQNPCHCCNARIDGFGLLCPFCMCAVHFGCYDYPEGCQEIPYSSSKNIQRVASFRFSVSLCHRNGHSNATVANGHLFRPVNIFTLCCCFVCCKPLWGCTMQGLRCMSCMQFAHSACMSSLGSTQCLGRVSELDSRAMSLDWAALRLSCIDHYHDILSLTKEQLRARSHEEISVFSAVLQTQLHIMTNGVSNGSIEIIQRGKSAAHSKGYQVDAFELHHVSEWCAALLEEGNLCVSGTLTGYFDQNKQRQPTHAIMYSWPTLVYIASTIKSPYTIPTGPSDLLNVAPHESQVDELKSISHPFEIAPIAHLRDMLGHDLLIHSDSAARLLLSHLHHLGFFNRLDMRPTLFDEATAVNDTLCVFPIPLGIDLSANVETLVSVVEACLTDLDLSVNEAGFLLLARQLWPNGMATEYSLKRLMRIIITWILVEDDNLASVLRDYLAKQRALPGIRSASDPASWPLSQSSRSTSVNNGGDYVAARRHLLNRYAVPWLREMHDQESELYGSICYEICYEIAQHDNAITDIFKPPSTEEQKLRLAECSDRLLRLIVRLAQTSGITFSTFDALYLRWLDHISAINTFNQPMPALHRLFPRETDASQRLSTVGIDSSAQEGVAIAPIDPWRVIMRVCSQSRDGLTQSLQWLCAFARSGIDIPVSIFERFASFAANFQASLADSTLLVDALLASSWLKPAGRQELQSVVTSLHSRLLPQIVESLTSGVNLKPVLIFIRKSLATCLLLYGSDRTKIVDLKLITDEVDDLPSRRKLNVRGTPVTDPIVIHPALMSALDQYVGSKGDDVICLVAKFLHTFLHDCPFLQSYEVDNFILRNGPMLARCAWQFYEVQRHEISAIRTAFLVRTVVVDSQPLQELLHDWLLPSQNWQFRLLASSRLFRIILDVNSPAFEIEGRQWRSSVMEVFYRYFIALWDEKEEIRLGVDTFASGLLPAHLEAISRCWTESLATSPIAERVKLISFLIQLRPYFPAWQGLAWDVIIDTLAEDEYDPKHEVVLSTARLSAGPGMQSTNTDPDMAILRGSILLLSLQMIADGISISPVDLQKIKASLAGALGFQDVTLTPAINGQTLDVQFGDAQIHLPEASLPCVNELLSVLDAPHTISLDPSVASTFLVGSNFVDVSLNLFCTGDLLALPIHTLKTLVESLGVIIYKHDFEHKNLRHLQPTLRRAVLRALELMLDNVSYEIRQLALSITQAFINRWPAYTGALIYTSIEQVVKLIVLQSYNSQDALVAQAKSFIVTIITTYANNGFVINLFKRRLDRTVFLVLKEIADANARLSPGPAESLRDVLLRDTLPRAIESDHTAFQVVMNNIQYYVEIVHHQGYSSDLMTFVGPHLTSLTRRALDLAAEGVVIESAPLLAIPTTLIQHNKANSREMLACVETILRGVLHRLDVDVASLTRLLHITVSFYRKTHADNTINPIVLAIFDVLAETLKLKTRTLSSTLRSMLETISTPLDHGGTVAPATTHSDLFMALVDPAFYYLQNRIWTDIQSENDFSASLAVGKVILQAAAYNSSIWQTRLPALNVRGWSIIVLAALMDGASNPINSLLELLPAFSTTHHAVLRAYTQSPLNTLESATADLNHAYIAIKLWLLLSSAGDADNSVSLMVWNELWPSLGAMIEVLEAEYQSGTSMTTASMLWSTVADLFVFLRCLRTPLALETSSQIAILNRLRILGAQDSSMSKLSRALKILTEPPPDIGVDLLLNQIVKDIIAVEKVRVLESRR